MDGITLDQRAQLNTYLTSQLGLTPEVLVEVAGRGVAALGWSRWQLADQSIGVIAGSGRTGAVALVAARWLLAWGARLTVHLGQPREALDRLNQAEVDRLELLGVRVFEPGAPLPAVVLWLDGLLGPDFGGELDDDTKTMIDTVNHDRAPVLAVDLPSGLDATSGRASLPAMRADVTTALGLPLMGTLKPFAKQLVGELILIDLGIPAGVWRRVGVTESPTFNGQPYIQWHSNPNIQ